MCIIFDANIVADAFNNVDDKNNKTILKWIDGGPKRLVTGGKNKVEIYRVGKAKLFFEQRVMRGKVAVVPDAYVEAEEKVLPEITSNDAHVIALARVSNCRRLWTKDGKTKKKALIKDFKNREILNPPGKIYLKAEHIKIMKNAPPFKLKNG
ncbi:MAG: type II toxin-antitoxin system VapC family toxin [Planctomycetes bacterium]|nr:type II toxin-antitoxin system VapC family toxin [Planctomycetota bacterium]